MDKSTCPHCGHVSPETAEPVACLECHGLGSTLPCPSCGMVKSDAPPAAPAAMPDGWQWVPKEPTMEMIQQAVNEGCGSWKDVLTKIYKDMLSAAPTPPQAAVPEGFSTLLRYSCSTHPATVGMHIEHEGTYLRYSDVVALLSAAPTPPQAAPDAELVALLRDLIADMELRAKMRGDVDPDGTFVLDASASIVSRAYAALRAKREGG